MDEPSRTILVTGATGYIGGRLVPSLLDRGYRVRCLVRTPEKLEQRFWFDHPQLEIVQGDLQNAASLSECIRGCDAAYYLIHSMESAGAAYAERDRQLAEHFAEAARNSSLKQLIYLGGLGELGTGLSEHLMSRREVEQILRQSDVPVTVFRAAMIIGAGSASFEILRYLVNRLPIMVTPRWVHVETQPIAIENVIQYLIDTLEVPESHGMTLDIGGTDVMSYLEIMQVMAKELGLNRRFIVPVPVLTPRLSSHWIGLVTPVSARIARPLAEGLRNRTVCRNDQAMKMLPQKRLLSIQEALQAAIQSFNENDVETNWSMAGKIPGDPDWAGGTQFRDQRSIEVKAPGDVAFQVISSIGGAHGYWGTDFLWELRGLMDQCVGGPGLRRGRRHPTDLQHGEAVDFWRVRKINKPECLTLHAEMWVPGDAQLEFVVEPLSETSCRVTQTARFRPQGLFGILYWYAVVPLHYFVFQSMLTGIKKEAEQNYSVSGSEMANASTSNGLSR